LIKCFVALMGKQEGGVNRSHYIRDNSSYSLINANKHKANDLSVVEYDQILYIVLSSLLY